jgi:predicted nucleotidyltransferase
VGDKDRSLPVLDKAGDERMEATGPQNDPVLAEIVRRLVAAYEPERIYLFGSHARGEAGPDSDYDLMVVVPESAPHSQQRSRRTSEALRGVRAAADVLVWSREEFDKRLHLRASLPSTIVREGRLLHVA